MCPVGLCAAAVYDITHWLADAIVDVEYVGFQASWAVTKIHTLVTILCSNIHSGNKIDKNYNGARVLLWVFISMQSHVNSSDAEDGIFQLWGQYHAY